MGSASWGIRARWAVPIHQPPLENALVVIRGDRIIRLARATLSEIRLLPKILDLGEAILLPGLVNAHAHFEFGPSDRSSRGKNFTGWLQAMLQSRASQSLEEYESTWQEGARQSLASGVTSVANIESRQQNLEVLWAGTPLRIFSFFEASNVKSGLSGKAALKAPLAQARRLRNPRGRNGISPHSAYAARLDLLRASAEASRKWKLPVTSHVSESREEESLFLTETGPLHRWIGEMGGLDSNGRRQSPVQWLASAGLLSRRFLAVHLNHLARGDLATLVRSGSSVVHCPRSHAYFGHELFPYSRLRRAGVNICLGTDSRASLVPPVGGGDQWPGLSLLEELAQFQRIHSIAPIELLKMATINGARALGAERELGEIIPGKRADLVAFRGSIQNSPAASLVTGEAALSFSMVGGRVAFHERAD